MTRQSLAMAIRDAAGRLAVERSPAALFRLAQRIDRLAPILVAESCAAAVRTLKTESDRGQQP